ncbi:hypothetical protein CK203_113737 [Vitis vinifera]|uniref:Reverse transcriptase domain-containing protein n=1 Tax=Vitis vinifera TaxID=29760 RepID=A0A438DN47_VITVI|nr:hypothetical protein CK203_113737 [Vitis vinifera]
MSEEVVRSLGPGRFLDWKVLNAMGTTGDSGMREMEQSGCSRGVYGPFSREDKECLWEELGAIRGLWEEPWCLGGDFNTTLYQAERSRNGRITLAMRRFAQIIDNLGLADVPLQGGSLTWSGGLNNQTWARLDRFLATPNWLDQYSRVLQRRLPRPTSDHFPVLLEGGGLRRGPSPFKFENMWLKAEGFKDLIEGWWQGIVVRGSRATGWRKTKLEALQQVESWDLAEEERNLTEEELGLKKEAKENYAKWVSMEEVHWRQLSRELWLREGDRNTGFFHRMANARRRVNTLDKIKINGVRITEEQEVREGIASAYQQLLSEDSGWKADIGVFFAEADQDEWGQSPGVPDGFTVAFWQRCWEILKEDILDMFKEFHDQNSFIKSLNHTFLVLLPEERGEKVISPDQNAFIKGRQILDGSLIANEVMHKMGFGPKWIGWMGADISLPKFSVLGRLKGVSSMACGIWRGRGQGVKISHLLFTDDTIVFWEVEGVLELAAEVGCRVGQLPTVYLGLPLGA